VRIPLHIITNTVPSAPCTDLIWTTYASFVRSFGEDYSPTVWVDSRPDREKKETYLYNLNKIFDNVRESRGFADAYATIVRESKERFAFILEHDWLFLHSNIKHSLEDLCAVMFSHGLIRMRFNKRTNAPIKSDKDMTPTMLQNVDLCLTSSCSNNPHIVDTALFAKAPGGLFSINTKAAGARGVERNCQIAIRQNAIYGGIGYPPTVQHLNGRKSVLEPGLLSAYNKELPIYPINLQNEVR
jgi:hypothetical protein